MNLSVKIVLRLLLLFSIGVSHQVLALGLVWTRTSMELSMQAKVGTTKTDFCFKNASDKPITILKLAPSCGCTSATSDKSQYAPGEAGSIHVVFTGLGLRGKLVNFVAVTTSDEATPTRLELSVNVIAPMEVTPRFFIWTKDDLAKKSARIEFDRSAPIEKIEIKHEEGSGAPDFTSAIQASSDPFVWYLFIAPPPSRPAEIVRTHIILRAKLKDGETLESKIFLQLR